MINYFTKFFIISLFFLSFNKIFSQGYWVQRANYTGTYLPNGAPQMQFQTFSVGNVGYILPNGANNNGVKMYAYDASSDTWSQKADAPEANYPACCGEYKWRQYGTAFAIANKGYIGCGNDASWNPTSSFFEYNPATNTWAQKTNFPGDARNGTAGYGNSTHGYLGLGASSVTQFNTDWYQYNPTTNSWVAKASLAAAGASRVERLNSFEYNGKIYVMLQNNEIWEYDPTLNSWALKTSGVSGQFYFVHNGKAIMNIGHSSGWSALDLANFTWSHGITPSPHYWQGFTINGRGFVLGDSTYFYEYMQNDIFIGSLPSSVLCPGSNFDINYTVNGVFNSGNNFNVELSDPTGSFSNPTVIGTINSVNSGTINVTIPQSTTSGSSYRIRVSSTNPQMGGFNNGNDISINMPPPTPSICLVTVDTLSTHNIVYWDKTPYLSSSVDGFIIYRESTPLVYNPIDTVSIDSLSEFHDIGFGSDPNITTYRYKLGTIDTCGVISSLSPYHNTVFVTGNGSGTFNYNLYEIEGAPNPVNNYVLYRDNLSDNNWTIVGFTSGTQTVLNDPSYATYSTTGRWRVETLWSISCTSTVFINKANVNTTRSNTRGQTTSGVGINEVILNQTIIYPNPSKDVLNISFPYELNAKYIIYDLAGKIIAEDEIKQQHHLINIQKLNKGMYFLKIKGHFGEIKKSFVKE